MDTIYIVNCLQECKPPLGRICILKVDSQRCDVALAGAVFTLYRINEDDTGYEEIVAGVTTDEMGRLTIEHLQPGKYQLLETKAPPGYRNNRQAILFEIKRNNEGKMVENPVITVSNDRIMPCKNRNCCNRCCFYLFARFLMAVMGRRV